MSSTDQSKGADQQLALEQAFQDNFIAKRLPAWLKKLDVEQLAGLKTALREGLACRHAMKLRVARLQGLDDFVKPLLQGALAARHGVHANLDTLYFRQWYVYSAGTSAGAWGRQPPLKDDVYDLPLLEAALRNFTVSQTSPDGQPRHNCIVDGTGAELSSPTAYQFAELCRELDLGHKYQQHLDSVLTGTVSGLSVEEDFASLISRLQRATCIAEAYKAYAEGDLSEDDFEVVLRFSAGEAPRQPDGYRVTAKQLELFGCKLEQIIVLDFVEPGVLFDSRKRVLVHVPGDPEKAWTTSSDLQAFARYELGKRLRSAKYQKFFSRFVRRRDQPAFFARVHERLGDVADWATRDLDEHFQAVVEPVFGTLATSRIAQIKDDAAVLAAPVAQLDVRVQQAQERYFEGIGETLVSVVGLFVPVVGATLLAVMAWEILGEVFQAVQDWAEGDTHEAIDHLVNVLEDLSLLIGVGAGATVAARVWRRSARVDSLVPAQLENGSDRLWSQDIAPFRVDAPPSEATRDAQGVHRLGERSWVEIDGEHYQVRQHASSEQWQLLPIDGHGPRLRHNGAGAWRLSSERPTQWQDVRWMFRRLGEPFRALDDERIDEALAIHGMDGDTLRALHVYNRAPDAELCDTVERIRGDVRIRDMISQLQSGHSDSDPALRQIAQSLLGRADLPDQDLAQAIFVHRRPLLQQLFNLAQEADTPASATLRRVFPGLSRRAAQTLLDQAGSADLRRLLDTQRIPMALAEAARARLLNLRIVRVYEALYLDVPQNIDLAQVALSMLKYLPGATAGVRWQLFEGALDNPPRASTLEGSSRFDLVHHQGQFLLFNGEGAAVAGPGELFEVMLSAYTLEQRQLMQVAGSHVHNLRVELMFHANQHRQEVQGLLARQQQGGFFAPHRLVDGRIGYPLSGRALGAARRGRPQALSDRVHDLFPDFDQAQIDAWVASVRASQQDLDALLQRLRGQSRLLTDHMAGWVSRGSTRDLRDRRRVFAEELLGVWRNSVAETSRGQAELRRYWWSRTGNGIGELPQLPETITFEQVAVMSLRDMQLHTVQDGFLRAFPNLHTLELPSNNLTRLPWGLAHVPRLQCLNLFNNRITLDPAQSATLASCEALVYLNLSHNPLRRGFSVHAMPALTELRLRNTRIDGLPHGVMDLQHLRALDLRDNPIAALPDDFFELDLWRHGNVWLAEEALAPEQVQRLRVALQAAPVGEPVNQENRVAPLLRWQDAIGVEVTDSVVRDDLATYWAEVQNNNGSEAYFSLLGRLTEVADFRNALSARNMANQLLEMLEAMWQSTDLRDRLFANAGELTCGDSVALRFADLRIDVLVWRAEQQANDALRKRALLRLGRQLWRLDSVDRIASEDVEAREAAGGRPDVIEVVLAYRLALRIDLDLPILTQNMLHGQIAGVDAAKTTAARTRVLQAESGPALAMSMVDREFWQGYLRHAYPARFDAMNDPFHQRMDALMADKLLTQAQVMAQTRAVQRERSEAEHALMLVLTLDALDVEEEINVR